MAKREIQSTVFASCQSITRRDNVRAFYNLTHLLKSSTSKTVISLMTSQITFCSLFFYLRTVYKNNFIVVSIMGEISYEDKMRSQTLREMDFGYKAIIAKFPTNMS